MRVLEYDQHRTPASQALKPADQRLDRAKIAIFEEIADQSACCCSDNDRVRRGQGLQTRREVGRFANN